MGVIYVPALRQLYWTDIGNNGAVQAMKATVINHQSITDEKVVNCLKPTTGGIKVIGSKSHLNQVTQKYLESYNVREFSSAGSSLKFCLIAEGEAHLYPRLGPTMEWDTAAGDAILKAAGGVVIDYHTKQSMVYGKSGYKNNYFIASCDKGTMVNVATDSNRPNNEHTR